MRIVPPRRLRWDAQVLSFSAGVKGTGTALAAIHGLYGGHFKRA